MSRLHADPVDVVRRDDAPEQFLWRERLYVVREVLAHWSESGAWWKGDLARAVTMGETVVPVPAGGQVLLEDDEREYWRVEAGRGRAAVTGVYDLCFAWSRGQWSLSRVLD